MYEVKGEICSMRQIVVTKDGSHTVTIPETGVMYHSVHGAVQESVHVYIEAGLNYVSALGKADQISIFEMGFGTGLNAFLSAIQAREKKINIYYTAIETAPLSGEEVAVLNYTNLLGHSALFEQLHQCSWNEDVMLNDFFTLRKVEKELTAFTPSLLFDLVYYDAFAPSAQPELWTKEVFEKQYSILKEGGALVTYCAKGDVRRALMAAGFQVRKLPGPKGKREMLRAAKL